MRVAIVDYGVGNLASIRNMLRKIGVEDVVVASDASSLIAADKLILPGVGAFDTGMRKLHESGLVSTLGDQVLEHGKPVLGICLGMQLLTESSEEGSEPGLGWIKGQTVRFAIDPSLDLKVPHMRWNSVRARPGIRLFEGLVDEFGFYFVHSYHVTCQDSGHEIGWASHGYEFACAVERHNVLGVQFHPEKSHRFGMQLLKNFVELY